GQKAALNGIPNLSVLDGWWAEGYNGSNGWAIGDDRLFVSEEDEDQSDASALYRVLEDEVIPLFYRRDAEGIPKEGFTLNPESINVAGSQFRPGGMVKKSDQSMSLPVIRRQVHAESLT